MPRGRRGGPGLLGVAVVAGGAAHVASKNANKNAQAQADEQAQNQQIADLQAQQDATAAASAAAAAPAPAAAPAVDPTTAELQKLAGLHSQGILTDEEFAAAKAKALGI
jgi:hypothetical protein